jgi:TPR repeat protein
MNLQLAIGWYRRAARQGEPNAKVLLKRLRVTE